MITLHIENTVHDYDAWRKAFDKYDRFRADRGVRSFRVSRGVDDPKKVTVDLDFDARDVAEEFCTQLEKIWSTPQSKGLLTDHATPTFMDLVESQTF